MTRTLILAVIAATVLSTTARAEDDGWNCVKPPEFVHGSSEIGWTVVCDNVVWLCPPESADDKGNVVQAKCSEAVPSEPTVVVASTPAPVATAVTLASSLALNPPLMSGGVMIDRRGTGIAFTPHHKKLNDQWVEIRTFGKTIRVRVDNQPTPVIYGGGQIRAVQINTTGGRVNSESVAISTDGNPAFLLGPNGGVIAWDILVEDETIPGEYVVVESHHIHVPPARGNSRPQSYSVEQGVPPGY